MAKPFFVGALSNFHSRFPDSFDIEGIYSMTDEGGISRRYDRHIGQFS